MKLTEQELEIFKAARAMYDGQWWGYICVSVCRAGQRLLPEDSSRADKEVMDWITESLCDGIVASMGNLRTFEEWLYEETGFRTGGYYVSWRAHTPKRPVQVINTTLFADYVLMARMAWLDKIIETGEIN